MWLSSGITAGSLLAGVVILVLSGGLVSRRTADTQIKQANDNAALWQKAAAASDARADLAVQQTEKLLTGLATVESLLRALSPPSPPGRGRR